MCVLALSLWFDGGVTLGGIPVQALYKEASCIDAILS